MARDVVARTEEGSKEGNTAGIGEGRRVEVDPVGGGAAAVAERRPGVKHCASGRENRAGRHVPEEEEERGGSGGAYLEISEIPGTSR
jgi:hypothetical protein